ncbi:MAG: hypothetical protein CMN55_06305 [Sneathiella sp.]|jgi:acyl-CoA thioester hydrolase|uniref:acyl-CoA thioesterase n=1 Tax=Sneathiella sp. TaxID=1964365 RepID=UPI000C5633C4|nr:thioesterase family protein [Sneathiella sp.]MAL78715.1 hypothetical protein [Sneathiella sp.]|tara:strand:+ start:209 stop:640 length:432 start_codon:yes stop_codon:yes gene_type:complete
MSGFIESYRGQVLMRECDNMGHMNVQFYIARVNLAMYSMFHRTGVDADAYLQQKVGIAAVEQQNQFLAELRAGDLIHMESAVLGATNKSMTFTHRLYNSADGKLAFTCRMVAVYMDLVTRRAIPLTDAMRRRIEETKAEEEAA